MDNRSIRKLESELWESADLLRAGSKLTSNQYCMPVLGLIFLRYAYSRFKLVEAEISDLNGEYVLAYSRFFGCSSDYILGLTDIRTPNVEIRRICELLGFSEQVVAELMKCQKDTVVPFRAAGPILHSSSAS